MAAFLACFCFWAFARMVWARAQQMVMISILKKIFSFCLKKSFIYCLIALAPPNTIYIPGTINRLLNSSFKTTRRPCSEKHYSSMTGPATTTTTTATTTRTHPASSSSSSRRRNDAPPIVHALGGSIGSALALLLFYPLERARIELQSKAAVSSSSMMTTTTSTRPINERKKETVEAISPIKRDNDNDNGNNSQLGLTANDDDDDDDDDNNNIIKEEASWDRVAADSSPSSWSMNSCSIDDNDDNTSTVSSNDNDNDNDSNNDSNNDSDSSTDSIFQCLLDLRERGVLYQGVKPIISTIFTRYVY